MSKHNSIYPNEEELKQVQNIVGTTEKALKLVSDDIAEEDHKAKEEASKVEAKAEGSEGSTEIKKAEGAEEGKKPEEGKPETKKQQPKTNFQSNGHIQKSCLSSLHFACLPIIYYL